MSRALRAGEFATRPRRLVEDVDDGKAGLLRDPGRREGRRRRRPEEGVSQAGDAVPPGPQPRRQAGGSQVQGSQRSLRRPQGRAEARRLRPLRPCRLREAAAVAGGFGFSGEGGLGDIFDQMFGDFMGAAATGWPGPRAAPTCAPQVEIDLAEAFAGVKIPGPRPDPRRMRRLQRHRLREARRRPPKPARPAAAPARCAQQQGFFLVERTCPTCNGAGRVIRNPCRVCQGAGTVQRERTLAVQIPAGVEDGTRIRLPGEGEAGGAGRPAGRPVRPCRRPPARPVPARRRQHLLPRAVPMTQAALGGEVEVPVIDGTRARVKVPPGTQTGDQFRLRGKGFSVLRSAQRGDMYHPGRGRDAAAPDPAGSASCWRSSRPESKATSQGQPRHRGLLRQGARVLRRRPAGLARAAGRGGPPRPASPRFAPALTAPPVLAAIETTL